MNPDIYTAHTRKKLFAQLPNGIWNIIRDDDAASGAPAWIAGCSADEHEADGGTVSCEYEITICDGVAQDDLFAEFDD